MKNGGIVNIDLLEIIARVGHRDLIVVTDRGFPFSSAPHVRTVDLSIVAGLPRLMDVVRPLANELIVEGVIVADETGSENREIASEIKKAFPKIPETVVPHHEFKKTVISGTGSIGRVAAQIRTGEWTRYGNVILVCGVAF